MTGHDLIVQLTGWPSWAASAAALVVLGLAAAVLMTYAILVANREGSKAVAHPKESAGTP